MEKFSASRKPAERRIRRRWRAAELLDNFAQKLKAQSEMFGRTLKEPDGNWPWFLVILPPDGDLTLVGIARNSLNSEETRTALSITVTGLAKEHKAVALAFLYGTRISEPTPNGESRVPEVTSVMTEVVMIEEARTDVVSVHLAKVQRFPDKPPALGTWNQMENPRLHARFVSASQPILQANYSRFVS